MESFPTRLWRSPARAPLIALPAIAISMIVNHQIGHTGTVELPPTIAIDILLAFGGLLFSVLGVAYTYWKKAQPLEMIERAQRQGRPICPCTEFGTVMLKLPRPKSGAAFKLFECPVCKDTMLCEQTVKEL